MTRPGRLRVAALAGGMLAVAMGVAPASAAAGAAVAPARRTAAGPAQASIVITSVSPNVAGPAAPNDKIVVSGDVVNPTGAPLSGALSVQLWSSPARLPDEAAMASYLGGSGTTPETQVAGAQASLASPLPAHASQHWSITLPVAAAGMKTFGVYPLAAQLYQDASPLAVARTFLPYWPSRAAARQIRPMRIAWVWPLIDVPQQAACRGVLLSDELAASVAQGGRLERLLAAGTSADGRAARITWAIDPALAQDVSVMTRRYRVGGSASCSGASSHPASAAASTWLGLLRSAVSRQDFFVTPYDDPDVAALSHAGLESQLYRTFVDGRADARKLFQGQTQRPSASGATGWIAWPPDGVADYGVLGDLAASPDQIQTVILSRAATPSAAASSLTPDAVATTPNGLGGHLNVLLADSSVNGVVSMPAGQIPGAESSLTQQPIRPSALLSPALRSQASAFAQEQWFLADTAVLAAQTPGSAGSVVVAPSRRWDPAPGVAQALLKETGTASAPWLAPTSLAALASAPPAAGQRWQPRDHQVSRGELRHSLLRQIQSLARTIQLQASIFNPPQPGYLDAAMAAVESSAWRGDRASQRRARALLQRVSAYVSEQMSKVEIIPSGRVTLAGKSGPVPVTIRNRLSTPVTVRLKVSWPNADQVTSSYNGLVELAAGAQQTVKVPVQTAQPGAITLTLRLTSPAGVPLPIPPATVTIETTQFGSLAIVIIGVVLLVFVVSAAVRAIRRGARPRPATAGGEGPDADLPDLGSAALQTDTVEAERTDDAHPPKGPDGHASTPGRSGQAGPARRG